jgi:glycosidase
MSYLRPVLFFFCFFIAVSFGLTATPLNVQHIAPPFWWTGMKNHNLQIMVHATDIAKYQVKLTQQGVRFVSAVKVENPNYLFINLEISDDAKAGKFNLEFSDGKKQFTYPYELKARSKTNYPAGLNSSDVMYLLMPDRFSNGDVSNDVVKTLQERNLNRDSLVYRHGGDIQGVINHLDYLYDLGVTALWLNPVLTNDQPQWSYHGYACTDNYNIDPRFGNNELYLKLINETHKRGMKMVMDIIFNHVGDQHWFIKDLPSNDWVHEFPAFTKTTYMVSALMDPYASQHDKDIMSNGWFDKHMPDLNQSNPLVANYLIQNTIWWVEYAQIDAYRLDTYAYSDLKFLEQWGQSILNEYPNLGIFGETWVQGEPIQAYFHGKTNLNTPFYSHLPGLTDFQLYYAINAALNESFGWAEGVSRLYYTLVKDYLYQDAYKNVIFLDNHDLSRFYSVVNEDIDKYKMGMGLLLTTRGIPCIYYGTEVLMKNYANPDGLVRLDFEGGWKGDKENKFESSGRTTKQNEAFNFVRNLQNWRKNNTVLHDGKLMQFIPENGVYTYFRYNNQKTVMVMLNPTDKAVSINTQKYAEIMKDYTLAVDVISDKTLSDLTNISIPPKTIYIFELKK